MFTQLDKAIAAVIFGVLSIVQLTSGWSLDSIGVSADMLTTILNVVIGPLVVYLVPNKAAE